MYDIISTIWSHLADEESKRLYNLRLKFSIEKNIPDLMEALYEEGKYKFIEWEKYFKEFDKGTPILIWGIGFNGVYTNKILKELKYNVKGFIDESFENWNDNCFSLEKAMEFYPEAIVFVAASRHQHKIYKKMTYWGYDSKRIFLPVHDRMFGIIGTQYFDLKELPHTDKEVFIDCGALDGSTSVDFAKWCEWNYEKIIMFEPEKCKIKKCNKSIADNNLHNAEVVDKGVWRCEDELSFDSNGMGNSSISCSGASIIKVTSIDEVLKGG